MNDDRLFDPADFRSPRDRGEFTTPRRKTPPRVTEHTIDAEYVVVGRSNHPPYNEAHRIAEDLGDGSIATECGLVGRIVDRLPAARLAVLCKTCSQKVMPCRCPSCAEGRKQ